MNALKVSGGVDWDEPRGQAKQKTTVYCHINYTTTNKNCGMS